MTRRLLNLLTALSLVLCVAVVVLWVRSYFATDNHEWVRLTVRDDAEGDDRYAGIRLEYSRGRVVVERFDRWQSADVPEPFYRLLSHPAVSYDTSGESIWFRIGFQRFSTPVGGMGFGFPCWFAFVMTATLPAVWVRGFRRRQLRRRRTAAGRCPS